MIWPPHWLNWRRAYRVAELPLQLVRARERWYELIDVPEQIALINAVAEGVRFPCVPAGRRSGKTERFKRFLAKQAMKNPGERYFAAAPTRDQAKKIFWQDLKMLTFATVPGLGHKISETELIITLPNTTEIHVLGLDKPERIEGVVWTGGGIDEIADVKKEALHVNVMPALDTVDPRRPEYRAWCWFLGVPDGLNHYYTLCEYARTSGDPTYGLYHWKSSAVLPPDILESRKRSMSKKQFRQEFEASFETATGRIYEEFGDHNLTDRELQPHEAIHWAHDQNFTPLSSSISVIEGDQMFIVGEIVLESAVSSQSAEEFVERYRDHKNKKVYIYGDPAGRAGEKHGHKSDYNQIEDVLRREGWRFERRVSKAHPAIKDRQNALRAKILNAADETSIFVNKDAAPWCYEGLNTVQLKKGSTFMEDQKNQYQHITTAIGYQVARLWPVERGRMAVTPPRRA